MRSRSGMYSTWLFVHLHQEFCDLLSKTLDGSHLREWRPGVGAGGGQETSLYTYRHKLV